MASGQTSKMGIFVSRQLDLQLEHKFCVAWKLQSLVFRLRNWFKLSLNLEWELFSRKLAAGLDYVIQ